jgi:hypothetical protein
MQRRLPLRDLGLWQRGEGLNAARRLEGRRAILIAVCFVVLSILFPPGYPKRILFIIGIWYIRRYYICTFGPAVDAPNLVRMNRRIDGYDSATFRNKFRFHKVHAHMIMDCLNFDDEDIILDNRCRVNSEEVNINKIYKCARQFNSSQFLRLS